MSDDELRRMYFRAIKPVSSLLDFIAFARSLEAARTSPTADDAKPIVGEAPFTLMDTCKRLEASNAELCIQLQMTRKMHSDLLKQVLKAATAQPSYDAKPVGEAVAWLWNEKPCEFNDYQSRPRVTFVRPKNTEAPGGMQALGVIATTAQPAKDSDDAQKAARYDWLQKQRSEVWQVIAVMPVNQVDEYIDAAIASAEREGK